ncbi:hypothetical protein [Salinisphaera sp. Q1T1-3]|uniref:hypothetical protein n=1 Tax=Salinisphaera sp. Q1T1-3 TaxID=2321229 RepID=UPI001F39EEE0|nr:hypothetical protein [Salinisphaera sp. Q1T1-3]
MSRSVIRLAFAGLVVAVLAGCVNEPPPPQHPGPYDDPVDAFNATRAPYDPNAAKGADQPLTRDLSQLRDARANYEHSQAVQRARLRDAQAKCRQQPDAHLVHIRDGSGDPDAVYCQSGPGQSDSDD